LKLRFCDNNIRLRLSRSEVLHLGRGERVVGRTDLWPQRFNYELIPRGDCLAPQLTFEQGTLTISLPTPMAADWAFGDAVAIEVSVPASPAGVSPLKLLIEKDFRCLHGPHEDQEDCFPNPLQALE
jgi:hypothetical protein